MNIIAVINQKGGVGKSTTALALGAGLSCKKKKVLFIDLDAQCNLSASLGAGEDGPCVVDLLKNRLDEKGAKEMLSQCIQKCRGAHVIPAGSALAAADISISGVGKEQRLKEALSYIENAYDYIVIDTPPALGILSINALTAAGYAIIPAQADPYSLQGIAQLHETISAVQEYTNPGLKLLGIVLTRYNSRAVLSREVAESMGQAAKKNGHKAV